MFAEAAKNNWEKLISGEPVCIEVPEWKTEEFDGKIYVKPESAKDRMKYASLLNDTNKRAEAFAKAIITRAMRYDRDGDLVLFYRTPDAQNTAVKTLVSVMPFERLADIYVQVVSAFDGNEEDLGNS